MNDEGKTDRGSYEEEWSRRTFLLLGERGLSVLRSARVAVIGVGAVGSFAVEALTRAGVGELFLVDPDVVAASNANRQLPATRETLGCPKVEVVAQRIRAIHPAVRLTALQERFCRRTEERLLGFGFDYLVDAVDELGPKVQLLLGCVRRGIPVVSSMGAASKLDPSRVRTMDLSETCWCPLARNVRKRLRRQGVERGIEVVVSDEPPILPCFPEVASLVEEDGCPVRGTISYMPALFGLHCASVVIRHLLRDVPFRRRGQYEWKQ